MVKADLPDMTEKDIDVRVENNLLTITGERKFREEPRGREIICAWNAATDRSAGASSLPNTVNPEGIHAREYNNGVLTVSLPKREESKPRQVKVNVTKASNS